MELNNKKQPKNKEIYVLSRKKIFDISEFYNLTPGNTKTFGYVMPNQIILMGIYSAVISWVISWAFIQL